MRWKIGCLMTSAGFILMIAIGVMGTYDNVAPSLIATLLIMFGAAILIFALIASSIAIVVDFWKAGTTAKPQELGSPAKPRQSGINPANKPTAPPSPVSKGRETLTRSYNMPIGCGSDFRHNAQGNHQRNQRLGATEPTPQQTNVKAKSVKKGEAILGTSYHYKPDRSRERIGSPGSTKESLRPEDAAVLFIPDQPGYYAELTLACNLSYEVRSDIFRAAEKFVMGRQLIMHSDREESTYATGSPKKRSDRERLRRQAQRKDSWEG